MRLHPSQHLDLKGNRDDPIRGNLVDRLPRALVRDRAFQRSFNRRATSPTESSATLLLRSGRLVESAN